jgi:hypothetical protein
MPQILLTGQLIEKPTYIGFCVFIVHSSMAAGYARRTMHLHYLTSVYFSFSTFLYLAASWTGVDKKIFALYVQNKETLFISFYFIRNQVSDSGLR